MISAQRLRKKPKQLHNFTGLKVEQFDKLVLAVKGEWQKEEGKQWQSEMKPLQRVVGGSRKSKLALENQVLVILIYCRLYLTQVLLGYLFDLDDSNISRLLRKM